MKINAINEYRVEVELADRELTKLGVTFETLDWDDIETRRALWNILDGVREQGVELRLTGKLLIEAGRLPGGIKLSFTVLPRSGAKQPMRLVKDEQPRLFRAQSLQAMASALRILAAGETKVYEKNGVWYLPLQGTYDPLRLSRAAEFGALLKSSAPFLTPFLEETCVSRIL